MRSNLSRLKPLLNIAAWLLSLVLIAFFWQRLGSQGVDLEQIYARLDWRMFALASGIVLIAHALRSQLGYASHQSLSFPLTRWQSYRFWALAQLAKYIPGGIWTFATGVVAFSRNGMPLVIASAAVTLEFLALLFTALIVSLMGVGEFQNLSWAPLIIGGTIIFMAVILLMLMPWSWRLLLRFRLKSAQKMLDILTELGMRRYMLLGRLSVFSLVAWVVSGIGFYILILSFRLPETINPAYAIASFALAWVIGFIVVISPSGLGPREAVLTALLTPVFGVTAAFSIALLARAWWTIADAIHISIALLIPVQNDQTIREKRHLEQP